MLFCVGRRLHPLARIIAETMMLWFQQLPLQMPIGLINLRIAWSKYKQILSPAGQLSVTHIHSLLGNVVYLLLTLGWDPVQIDVWKHGDDLWKFQPHLPFSKRIIIYDK